MVRDTGRFRETGEELRSFTRLLDEQPSFRNLMENPAFSASQRLEVLDALRDKLGLSDPVLGFLRLVIRKNRISRLREMETAYAEYFRRELGIQPADVVVAEPIDAEMERRLSEVVRRMTGKTPELTVRVDPDQIGGIKIRMGNTILDASIKSKLEDLRESLLQSQEQAA